MNIGQLCRRRWPVRLVLVLTAAANLLSARPTLVGRVIAGWPAVAALLAIELTCIVPVGRRWMAVLRLAVTVVILGVAVCVSWLHMATAINLQCWLACAIPGRLTTCR
jgi:hypothetical protein